MSIESNSSRPSNRSIAFIHDLQRISPFLAIAALVMFLRVSQVLKKKIPKCGTEWIGFGINGIRVLEIVKSTKCSIKCLKEYVATLVRQLSTMWNATLHVSRQCRI
ncbi:hypothetical protein L1887_10943 [Cichorium endivia]|nr:hypothetical protein L1887_10943 [Cichorium endivia]